MKLFKKYFYLVSGWKLLIFLLMTIIANVCTLIIPQLYGKFIDICIVSKSTDFILSYSLKFIFLSSSIIIINYFSIMLNIKIQTKAAYKNNVQLIDHLNNISPKEFSRFDIVYLTQRVNEDVNAVVSFCINTLKEVLINSITLALTFVLIFLFNKIIAIAFIILFALYITIYKFYRQKLYNVRLELQEVQNNFFSQLNNQLYYSKFIRINNVESFFRKHLDSLFNCLISKVIKNQKINYTYSSFDSLINMISTLSLLVFGGIMLVTQNITIGSFTIAYTYLGYMFRATKYFLSLGQSYQNTMVSYNRIEELLQFKKQKNGNIILDKIQTICVEKVVFSYDKNISFHYSDIVFEEGKIYCIKGANGVGKSTFLDILIGLYSDDYSGTIKYNNVNLEELNLIDLRKKHLSILSNFQELIDGITIQEFIQIGNDKFDRMKFQILSELLCLNNLISGLKKGFDTVITDHGKCFSTGERQKISILRVLLKEANVILMDEPTSAMDSTSKQNLMNYLDRIKYNKIIIMITHDPDLLLHSDIIICMDSIKSHTNHLERSEKQ